MAISEESRHRLYARPEEVVGPQDASTLMEHLPPVGWADVATKRDLDHTSALLRSDLRGEMVTLGTELRGEMAGLRTKLRDEMAGLRTEMVTMRSELRTEIAQAAVAARVDLRNLFLGLVGLQVSAAGLALAVARLG